MSIHELLTPLAHHVAGAILDIKLPKKILPNLPEYVEKMESVDFSRYLYETQTALQGQHSELIIAPRILITGSEMAHEETQPQNPGEMFFAKHSASMRDVLKAAIGLY